MKKLILAVAITASSLFVFQACNSGNNSSTETENTDIVESGTYTGTADKVDADEKEIYVKTEDGKTLELYFTEGTTVTQNGQAATFDALKQGQKVEVTIEKKGNRLEPIAVTILE